LSIISAALLERAGLPAKPLETIAQLLAHDLEFFIIQSFIIILIKLPQYECA
jgi:hypothetical protein